MPLYCTGLTLYSLLNYSFHKTEHFLWRCQTKEREEKRHIHDPTYRGKDNVSYWTSTYERDSKGKGDHQKITCLFQAFTFMHGTLVFSIVSTHFSYVELLNITWKDNYRLPNVLVLSAVVLGDIVTHVLLYSYIGLVCYVRRNDVSLQTVWTYS